MPSESPLKQFWSLAEALPLPEVFHDALYLCHPAVSDALLEDGLGSLLVLPPDPTGWQSSTTVDVVRTSIFSVLLRVHYYLTLVRLVVTATLPRKGAECPQLLMSSVPCACVAVCVTTQSLVLPPPTFLSYLQLHSPSHSLRSSSDTCMHARRTKSFHRKTHGFHPFSHPSPHIWNSRPQDFNLDSLPKVSLTIMDNCCCRL